MYLSALLVVCIMAYVLHTPYYRQSFSNMFYDYLGVCTVVRNMAYVIHDQCILRIFNTETQLIISVKRSDVTL